MRRLARRLVRGLTSFHFFAFGWMFGLFVTAIFSQAIIGWGRDIIPSLMFWAAGFLLVAAAWCLRQGYVCRKLSGEMMRLMVGRTDV